MSDASYNAHSREIHMKLEIYFDGLTQDPLVVTRDDFLIDCELLEEASAESGNPLGAVSSNELSFNLFNDTGLFSPTNTESIYYNKIHTGIAVKPFIRCVETEWTQLGVFYVSDWKAAITGTKASITAHDKLQQVFLESTPDLPVKSNQSFKAFIQDVFNALGYPVTISDELDQPLLYSFIDGAPKNFVQEIMQGAISYCMCNKLGNIVVEVLTANKPLRATLTDSDQILSVDMKQSILKTYSGVELTYSLPQLTEQVQLLLLKDLSIPIGTFEHNKISISRGPVKQISNLYALTSSKEITIVDYSSSPWDICIVTYNGSNSTASSDIAVYGFAIDFVKAILSDSVTNALKASSRYIQNQAYAYKYKRTLNAFVSNDMPILTLSIRGNPLLSIGDKIRVVSTKYNLDFVGILQRVEYNYVGSLSCSITLLNAEILKEAT